ncbi:MAG TPA: DNA (cytosine-5-)-methyltransferase [bacterium]|nr:DNA (cytosine-5-)-methyltransferase [bacterium]
MIRKKQVSVAKITKYSEYKKNRGFEKLTSENMDKWAKVSHGIQSIGHSSEKYFGKYLKNFESEYAKNDEIRESASYQPNLFEIDVPFPPPADPEFTFIDLFAGIGGFRIAMQKVGGKCVFSSEWDKYARLTYEANFGETPFGDITKINEKDIPEHDILCAGFPCQPFSLAGIVKKESLGRSHGFEDEKQGTLFFDVARIIKEKRPKAFFLENVKNLISHDAGKTFKIIMETLEKELGYVVNYKIIDGIKWVPQHRERIFIVGYNSNILKIDANEIIIPDGPGPNYKYIELKDVVSEKASDEYTLGSGTWNTLVRHKKHHKEAGNGFGYGIIKTPIKKGVTTRTISARYHKDGAEILIEQRGKRPRRLTIKEAMQLQGYDPERFIFPVSKTQAYRQIGNSVVVPAISACAKEIYKIILGVDGESDK